MFTFFRVVFFGALALLALIPIGIILAAVGLPIVAVLCLLALPVILVLFLIGLPFFILFVVGTALIGATVGVIMAFLSLGVIVLKIAFVVLVPLLILGWVLRRVFAPADLRTADY
jgi:hypothetical protein